jgi:hypothetical protein
MLEFIVTFTDKAEAEKFDRYHGTNGELVRCKDCRFAKVENDYGLDEVTCYNEEFGPHCLVPLDWFCADGERRESE